MRKSTHRAGFTLIETMVAIALLSVAIVAPMSLVAQSLSAAFYARDQVTAYYLAQEGIEVVRALRDQQILAAAIPPGGPTDIMADIPEGNQPFRVDARFSDADDVIATCNTTCPFLRTDGTLYGYTGLTENTHFRRTLRADFVNADRNEMRLEVTVEWTTAALGTRTFTIKENMYRWYNDDAREAADQQFTI